MKYRTDVYCEHPLHEERKEDRYATYDVAQPGVSKWVCGYHLRWGVREVSKDGRYPVTVTMFTVSSGAHVSEAPPLEGYGIAV